MNQEEQPVIRQLNFPNRENATQGHVANLLSVCNIAVHGLASHWGPETDDKLVPEKPEGKIALENTLIKACERLDAILDDEKRWDLGYQIALEKDFKEAHRVGLETKKAQMAASQEINTPHFQYKPTLYRTESGLWAAILGNPQDAQGCVAGFGRTPEESMTHFDQQFRGERAPKTVQFLKERQAALEQQANYDKVTVDGNAIGTTEPDGKGQDSGLANCAGVGPESGVHPGETSQLGGEIKPCVRGKVSQFCSSLVRLFRRPGKNQ